uniref:Uncharacterized protein n=1 Tax=Periophthalmus magnuspinnatus TaxID=409849 RepID=A0A3B4A7U7_9GOBI
MADCDGEGAQTPLQLYERLTAQGDQVRALKTAKAEKVRNMLCHAQGLQPEPGVMCHCTNSQQICKL